MKMVTFNLSKFSKLNSKNMLFFCFAGVVENGNPPDPTYGSTYYYAYNVISTPHWAQGKTPAATIGGHRFYNNID